uniref:Uncharacterized protein n=1 Tax=uncultured Caudovirales phage TaxID=2100421 RepID=A0A6J5L3U6_9CAUD|nr:hypothetical protein UFOVP114_2 [uncultured Caudovirales phage]
MSVACKTKGIGKHCRWEKPEVGHFNVTKSVFKVNGEIRLRVWYASAMSDRRTGFYVDRDRGKYWENLDTDTSLYSEGEARLWAEQYALRTWPDEVSK